VRRARKRSRADAAIGILPGRNIWSEGIESRSEIRGPDQRAGYENLRRAAAQYRTPSFTRSLSQIISSFGGFFAACAAMYALWDVSYAITLALSPLAGGFLALGLLLYRRRPLASTLAGMATLRQLHEKKHDVPYAIAIGLAGLVAYPLLPILNV